MTPNTKEHYLNTVSKLGMVSAWIGISYEPIDLMAQHETHLLLLEGLRNLMAVVVEGTLGDGAVEWISGGAPPAS
jgi:hypothetical protein